MKYDAGPGNLWAIVLAAGRGTRLAAVTKAVHKTKDRIPERLFRAFGDLRPPDHGVPGLPLQRAPRSSPPAEPRRRASAADPQARLGAKGSGG